MPTPDPYCPACGVVLEDIAQDIAGLERDLRAKRAQLTRLRNDEAKALKEAPQYNDAMTVLRLWRDLCAPKARELTGKRLEVVVARLRAGYALSELMRAVHGYASFPYIVDGKRCREGKRAERWVDAELIFRDAKHVEAGLALAEIADEERGSAQDTAYEWVARRYDELVRLLHMRKVLVGIDEQGERHWRLTGEMEIPERVVEPEICDL